MAKSSNGGSIPDCSRSVEQTAWAEEDEFSRRISSMLNSSAASLARWEVVELARWINTTLNGGAATGGEGGIAHLAQCEVVKLVKRINKILNRCAARRSAARSSEGESGLWAQFLKRINMILNPGAVGRSPARGDEGGSPHLARCEVVELVKRINVILNPGAVGGDEGGTSPLPGFEIIPEVELASQNDVLSNQDAAGGNELPDSMPLNMSTSPAYHSLGSAHGTSGPQNRASSPGRTQAVESHNIDIKDEETDKKFSEWSNALTILAMVDSSTLGLLGTGVQGADVLMPKNYSKTILGLFTVSLTGLFCIGVFYKKLPAKFANPATYLTFACNASAFFLLAVFYLINI